jgi:hypothetical protein
MKKIIEKVKNQHDDLCNLLITLNNVKNLRTKTFYFPLFSNRLLTQKSIKMITKKQVINTIMDLPDDKR